MSCWQGLIRPKLLSMAANSEAHYLSFFGRSRGNAHYQCGKSARWWLQATQSTHSQDVCLSWEWGAHSSTNQVRDQSPRKYSSRDHWDSQAALLQQVIGFSCMKYRMITTPKNILQTWNLSISKETTKVNGILQDHFQTYRISYVLNLLLVIAFLFSPVCTFCIYH